MEKVERIIALPAPKYTSLKDDKNFRLNASIVESKSNQKNIEGTFAPGTSTLSCMEKFISKEIDFAPKTKKECMIYDALEEQITFNKWVVTKYKELLRKGHQTHGNGSSEEDEEGEETEFGGRIEEDEEEANNEDEDEDEEEASEDGDNEDSGEGHAADSNDETVTDNRFKFTYNYRKKNVGISKP